MTITVEIPDALEGRHFRNVQDPARSMLEAFALEGDRAERLTASDIRKLLGYETRMEVHAFLKENQAYMHRTMEDLAHDIMAANQDALRIQGQRQAASECHQSRSHDFFRR